MDSSTKSIGNAWMQILEFTNSVIAGYDIGQNCIRAAVISYSDNAVVNIVLNQYGDRNSLQQAVRQLRLLSGGSNLVNAFNLLRTRVFVSNIIRPNTATIAVVVTDRIQSSPQLTDAANSVKSQGIRVIAVGINRQGQVDRNALYGVSTNNYAVIVGDYSQLSTALNRITARDSWGCFQVIIPTPPLPGACFIAFCNHYIFRIVA